jgi:hypothetical protein
VRWGIQGVAEYAIRVLFGTALLASILIVYSTIIVLLSSGRRCVCVSEWFPLL